MPLCENKLTAKYKVAALAHSVQNMPNRPALGIALNNPSIMSTIPINIPTADIGLLGRILALPDMVYPFGKQFVISSFIDRIIQLLFNIVKAKELFVTFAGNNRG